MPFFVPFYDTPHIDVDLQGTEDEVSVLVAGSETNIVPRSTGNIDRYPEDAESSKFISYQVNRLPLYDKHA